jgi:hypothetical protein
MDDQKFIDVLDLATEDVAGFLPDLAGIILIAVTIDDEGAPHIHMATNIKPALATNTITMLHRHDAMQKNPTAPYKKFERSKLRKGV